VKITTDTPRLKNDGTVFARDGVKMFQNMQKKGAK
jgi:hypothetical protein